MRHSDTGKAALRHKKKCPEIHAWITTLLMSFVQLKANNRKIYVGVGVTVRKHPV